MREGAGRREQGEGGRERGALTRREALGAAAAGVALPVLQPLLPAPGLPPPLPWTPAQGPRRTPTDPDLLRPRVWWEPLLTERELGILAALCDTIIPADERSPSASAVGVPQFINEWASAPYDHQRSGLVQIRGGLAWLDAEARRRFERGFEELTDAERRLLCDQICHLPDVRPGLEPYARFFDLVRDLTATGYYTTREGMSDLGYVGNVALPRYDGPPAEVRRHLGLD